MEMAQAILPPEFYRIIGVLVVLNAGALISALYLAFKAIWWSATIDAGFKDVKGIAMDAKDLAQKAHIRIDLLTKQ